MHGKLYIVATPIGNLSDMTPRGIQTLTDADMIAAEDTRHSKVLLSYFGIKTPTFSCHKFNEEKRGDFFITSLKEGKSIALISDAGTPCISDPGHRLVKMAYEAGIEVISICGANAVAAALSVSGFDASQFMFLGFLPRSAKEIEKKFTPFHFPHPIVFYESPLRITKTLAWMAENYPVADICLCNDLTKRYERIYRGSPETILEELMQNPNAGKGEYTCVTCLNAEEETEDIEDLSLEAQLVDIIVKHSCTLKDAANILHKNSTGVNRKTIYTAMLKVKELLQ